MRRLWVLASALIPAACVDLSTLSESGDPQAGDEGGAPSGGDAQARSGSDGGIVPTSEGGAPTDAAARDGATPSPSCNGAALCERVVFATHQTFTASLGGLAGADLKCNQAAASSTYDRIKGRSFVAWLSTDTMAAAQRLVHGGKDYIRPDGRLIANGWGSLVNGSIDTAISLDEKGFELGGGVWTGTSPDGTSALDLNCTSWTSSSGVDQGESGVSTADQGTWTSNGVTPCSTFARLYCVER